jgi:hypothetical protein
MDRYWACSCKLLSGWGIGLELFLVGLHFPCPMALVVYVYVNDPFPLYFRWPFLDTITLFVHNWNLAFQSQICTTYLRLMEVVDTADKVKYP